MSPSATTPFRVRAAGPEDFPAINYLIEQVDWLHIEWHPEYFQPNGGHPARPDSFLQRFVDSPHGEILLALDQAGLVGAAIVQIEHNLSLPLLRHAPRVVIDNLIVDAAQRGIGIGKTLLRACQDWAEHREIFEVQLNVYEANTEAMRFYERQGFEPLRRTYRLRW
jgi:ribosomal protein S18 acetylase RimI-like enzyme